MDNSELKAKLIRVLDQAKLRGMDHAEAAIFSETGFTVSVRHGEVETVEHHQAKSLHVTVYHDYRSGSTATSDLSAEAILSAVDKACAIASYAGQDHFGGLAEPEFLAKDYPDLKLFHHWDITPNQAISIAIECDSVAREQDARITDAEGSSVGAHDSYKLYGNTHGFIGGYQQSMHSISCAVVAQEGDQMQRDHEYTMARSAADLVSPVLIAKQAAQKVLRRLNPQRLSTRRCPVIFHAPLAKGLLSHFISAISGRNLYQQSSFLLDHLGKKSFPGFCAYLSRAAFDWRFGKCAF